MSTNKEISTWSVVKRFKTKSSDSVHTVEQNEDGDLKCSCQGFRIQKKGYCKHTEEISTKDKIYIIVELGWEYNDENYYRPESDGGKPKNYSTSKKEADKMCGLLNTKKHKELLAGDMYDMASWLDEGVLDDYETNDGTGEWDFSNIHPEDLPIFYEVIEVESL